MPRDFISPTSSGLKSQTGKLTASLTNGITRKLTGAELEELFLEKFKFTLSDTELITNGTFDSDTSGWTAGGGATLAIDSNRLKITNDSDGFSYAHQAVSTVVGKTYTVSVGYTDDTGSNARLWMGTAVGGNNLGVKTFTTTGHYTLTFTATSSTSYILVGANEATNGTIYFFDNVSVKEITKQAPVAAFSLRKLGDVSPYACRIRRSSDNTEAQVFFDASDRVSESSVVRNTSQNILLYSEDFSQSSYTKIFSGIQDASQIVDPFGGNNAVRLAADTNNGQHRLDISTTVGTGSHTFSIYAKAADYGSIWLRRQGSSSVFNLENGTVISDSGNNNPTITAVGNDGWYRVSITNTGSANDTFRINFAPTNSPTADYQGTGTSGIYIFGAMLEETVTYETINADIAVNGDFEADSDWGVFGSPVSQGRSSALSHSGSHSWYIDADAFREGIQAAGNNLSITAGRKYEVSMWIYATDGAEIQSGISNTDQGVFTGRSVTQGEWTNVTYTAIGTATAASYISILSSSSTQDFYVDDLTIKELSPIPSEYISTPVVSNDGLTFVESTLDDFVGGENLLTISEDFNSWITQNSCSSTTPSPMVNDPLGGTATQLLTSTSVGGNVNDRKELRNQVMTASVDYIFSVYLKKGTTTKSRLQIYDTPNTTNVGRIDIDWDSSGVPTSGATGGASEITYDLISNGWYRVSFKTTPTQTTTDARVRIFPDRTTNNASLYVFGVQLNSGSIKTYQKTTGTARAGNASIVTLYNQTGGEDAIQSNTAHQPLLYNTGLLVRSGSSPAIEFVAGSPQRNLVFQGLTGIDPLDAFFVQEANDNQYIYPSSNNGTYYGWVALDDSSGVDVVRGVYGSPILEVNGSAVSLSTEHDVHTALNGRKLVYHRSARTTSWPEVNIGNTFGNTHAWNLEDFKFSEIIFFDSDQHSNQAAIEQDLNDFHNIF